jgi:hypothetical protein
MNNFSGQLFARTDRQHCTFDEFVKAAECIPRVCGNEWAGEVKPLARYLNVGDIVDPLCGIREMADEQVRLACLLFSKNDFVPLDKAGRNIFRVTSKPATAVAAATAIFPAMSTNSNFITLPEVKIEDIHRFSPERGKARSGGTQRR